VAHPYKSQADSTKGSKKSSMTSKGLGKNTDFNGAYKKVQGSSASMQHMEQSAVPGMKRGGRAKGKSKLAKEMATAALPSAETMMSQAGAGAPSPTPAPPPPGLPGMMQKRGGAVKKACGGAFNGVNRLKLSKK